MKPASPELLALLASRQYFAADLFTFSGGNLGNTVLRYTSGDADIVANGKTYSSGGQTGPYFDRQQSKAKCHWKLGVEADTLTFSIVPGSALVLNVPFQTAVKYGLFDGATMLLEKAFMATYGDTSAGVLRYFLGRVASVDSGRTVLNFNVASHLELLNLQLPRNLYQSSCKNNWGDKACGVNQATYSTAAVITTSASTTSSLIATITGSFPAGTFSLGKVLFTSGANNGFGATVKTVTYGSPATIALLAFLPVIPAAGDTLTLFFGCDKTLGANGCAKFANQFRFRAERLVPSPVTIL